MKHKNKNMKISVLFISLFCGLHFIAFSQNGCSHYKTFYNGFLSRYMEQTKPPLQNYYEALSNAAKSSFTPYNPYFEKALSETIKNDKLSEMDALDTLFNRVFREIKLKGLWINATEIYNDKKELFEVYNRYQCPCYTSKVKNTDRMEKLLKAVQDCTGDMVKDTAFINGIRQKGGNNTLNDLFALQQYASLYMYANCEIINSKLNESIKNYPVYEMYFAWVSAVKVEEGKNVMRYFRNKQYDSLAVIFPGYRKYINEFNKIELILKKPVEFKYSNYQGVTYNNIPKIILVYAKNKKGELLGEVNFTTTANAVHSTILSINFTKYKPMKLNDEDRIIEIKPN
jgi:hypothetical protein